MSDRLTGQIERALAAVRWPDLYGRYRTTDPRTGKPAIKVAAPSGAVIGYHGSMRAALRAALEHAAHGGRLVPNPALACARCGAATYEDGDGTYCAACRAYVATVPKRAPSARIPGRPGGKARIAHRGLTFAGYNAPRPAPAGDKHKYVVLARQGGRVKLVRFGLRGYSDYLKHRDPARRRNFKARHRCAAKADKLTAGWWACNYNW